MKLDEECKGCLFNSQMKKVEREQSDENKLKEFKDGVRRLCQTAPADYCAPLLMRDIDGLHREIFGSGIDYSREKFMFNSALLNLEDDIYASVASSRDPLESALKFASAANYIDFARISDLNEDSVNYVLETSKKADIDKAVLSQLKERLKTSETLCFLHDNCGEIVLDKILIRIIKQLYPQISVTSVVRGQPIINDVTETDAGQVGLENYARVVNNGSSVPGTYLKEISGEAKKIIDGSDIIISKGLGNLETLYGVVKAFFAFTCKCGHIARCFNLKLWSAGFIYG